MQAAFRTRPRYCDARTAAVSYRFLTETRRC